MRRLARWLFNALAILSLLLCVGAAWLWGQSYYRCDNVGYISAEGSWTVDVQTLTGQIVIFFSGDSDLARRWRGRGWGRAVNPPEIPGEFDTRWAANLAKDGGYHYHAAGFRWLYDNAKRLRPGTVPSVRVIGAPFWSLVLLLAIFPALRLRYLIRRRRAGRLGLCSGCGYDLRASPERCPECGRAVATTAASRAATPPQPQAP